MLASAQYPHAELLKKTTAEKHEMLHEKGVNWAKEATDFKRGRVVRPMAGEEWGVDLEIPIFNRERGYLDGLIPVGGLGERDGAAG
jgi:tRNA(His) 5'-end guanylyltransferase